MAVACFFCLYQKGDLLKLNLRSVLPFLLARNSCNPELMFRSVCSFGWSRVSYSPPSPCNCCEKNNKFVFFQCMDHFSYRIIRVGDNHDVINIVLYLEKPVEEQKKEE